MQDLNTCFKRVDYDLSGLLNYIDNGDIGLPDIQRPFVWSNARVRDLFDSMYRGFPIGYVLFWQNAGVDGVRPIGTDNKVRREPQWLVVDGQQRLTSLYAVFRGVSVVDADYRERRIEIAFRPRDGRFEVSRASLVSDPEWIGDISVIWSSAQSSRKMINEFIDRLSFHKELTAFDEEQMAHNLDRLFDLQKYPFTALEIGADVEEEQVADIFVRINSKGSNLDQADFIHTLLSVFWDEGRGALDQFCRDSRAAPVLREPATPFNHFIEPRPEQMLRVSVALGFNRARLKSVYNLLRGKDPNSGTFDPRRREKQFRNLKIAQGHVLSLRNWHQYLHALVGAGFRDGQMISSERTLLFVYALYLIGRVRFAMDEISLQRTIGRWFFVAALAGRYSGGAEAAMENDLMRIRDCDDAAAFLALLRQTEANQMTGDFWKITLPALLESASSQNPGRLAFIAAQNLLAAPVLFSRKSVRDLLDPSIRAARKPLESHHLFPRAWLERQGVTDRRLINQIANHALLEWPENLNISDQAPSAYVPALRQRFEPERWARMHELHALPPGWETLPYGEFLTQRRHLMAGVIRRGYDLLGSTGPQSSDAAMRSTPALSTTS